MIENQEKIQTTLHAYRRVKSIKVLKYLGYLLGVGFLVLIYWILATKGLLDISNVRLKSSSEINLKYVNSSQVKKAILDQKVKNYFEINLEKLEKDVKGSSSFIGEVFFTKTFPNKILVEITERQPYLIIQINNSECNLISDIGYVLDKQQYENDKECLEIKDRYKVPILKMSESKIPFDVNTQSAFFTIQDIVKLRKVFATYGVIPVSYELKNGVLYSFIDKDHYIVTSANQDMVVQLSRFVVVIKEIEERGIEYKFMDLRYKRPVINRK